MNAGVSARPTLLTVLCILSFIGAGFGIIGGIIGWAGMKAMNSGAISEMVAESGDADAMAKLEEASAKMSESGLSADQMSTQLLLAVVLAAVSLVGVIMMWKLKKMGFWVYSLPALLGIAAPLLMGGKFDMSVLGLIAPIITIAFIVLYWTQTKVMS